MQRRRHISTLIRKTVEALHRTARFLNHDLGTGCSERRQRLVEDLDPPKVAGAEDYDLGRRRQQLFEVLRRVDVAPRLTPPGGSSHPHPTKQRP